MPLCVVHETHYLSLHVHALLMITSGAAYSGQLECCQWLMANEASHSAEDNNERTPYDIAKV